VFKNIFGKRHFVGYEKLYEASMSLGEGEALLLKLKNLDEAIRQKFPLRRLKEKRGAQTGAYTVDTLPAPSTGCTCNVPYVASTFEDLAMILTSDRRVMGFGCTWFYKEKGRLFSPVYRVGLQFDLHKPPFLSDVIVKTDASKGGDLAHCLRAQDLIARDLKLIEPRQQAVTRRFTPPERVIC
jgi:hypothetical protein